MAESEAIQTAITQAAIQAATMAVKALKEAGTEPESGMSTANLRQAHRLRHGGPAIRQLSFKWKAPDTYVELLNFEMEVTNILQCRTYKLNDEWKVLIIKTG